ncbi:tRNA lysidine(34) synthetase TilS [Micromonospora sp. NBC_01796]|uniref:tRNA lysidine(34) synthetase TilS n=1 Tax=Micromonospora sp. NBC_01796 TaxID=2975987 RepID=UPI002DD987C8|nr:tRNA lysidine(34) synthetase TilS [Micromonospora sp. NBC_01796]WSA88279.1 tRNA lysidine(34) synthetase TilS [Micromonospora sp. NBC_01796]
MAALAPPVAAVRAAVRSALTGVRPPGPILVACSGGADSLALAAATAFVAPRLGLTAGLVTVDHGLQAGSAERALEVAGWATAQGLAPVEVATVVVAGRPGGPEAAARQARYQALVEVARRHGAAAVLLGHTRDDQAETVLLALARGAGPHGLSGMPVRRELDGVPLLRPLLDVDRDQTRKACAALGLSPWEDPHNTDPGYARARVRADLMPALVATLGTGVVANLARTARLIAEDTAVLDGLAAEALVAARTDPENPARLAVGELVGLPGAVRTRVLHRWALELGVPAAALSARHVAALDALLTDWHGQGPVHLPGAITVARRGDALSRG